MAHRASGSSAMSSPVALNIIAGSARIAPLRHRPRSEKTKPQVLGTIQMSRQPRVAGPLSCRQALPAAFSQCQLEVPTARLMKQGGAVRVPTVPECSQLGTVRLATPPECRPRQHGHREDNYMAAARCRRTEAAARQPTDQGNFPLITRSPTQ